MPEIRIEINEAVILGGKNPGQRPQEQVAGIESIPRDKGSRVLGVDFREIDDLQFLPGLPSLTAKGSRL